MTAAEPAAAPNVDLVDLAASYVAAARVDTRGRRQAVRAFQAQFGDLHRWRSRPVGDRMAASEEARAFASFAAVGAGLAVDAEYVVVSASKWGLHVADRDPEQAARFRLQAASLGFAPLEVAKMWSKLAQICVITGQTPDTITAAGYLVGRDAFAAAVDAKHNGTSPKSLRTPLFGLNAVMFHRGQAPRPEPREAVGSPLGPRDRLGGDHRPGAGTGGHHAPLPRPAPDQPPGLICGLHRDHAAPVRRPRRHPQRHHHRRRDRPGRRGGL